MAGCAHALILADPCPATHAAASPSPPPRNASPAAQLLGGPNHLEHLSKLQLAHGLESHAGGRARLSGHGGVGGDGESGAAARAAGRLGGAAQGGGGPAHGPCACSQQPQCEVKPLMSRYALGQRHGSGKSAGRGRGRAAVVCSTQSQPRPQPPQLPGAPAGRATTAREQELRIAAQAACWRAGVVVVGSAAMTSMPGSARSAAFADGLWDRTAGQAGASARPHSCDGLLSALAEQKGVARGAARTIGSARHTERLGRAN